MKFRIELAGIAPLIWREILVPARYSFWDLHVAIQDSMGWWDSHLHAFRPPGRSRTPAFEFGIPTDDDFTEVTAGWEVFIADYFPEVGVRLSYEYDFGDGWEHGVELLAIEPRVKGRRYPQCVGGERACPPEDCGGVPGYQRLTEALLDPKNEEHEDLGEWIPKGWGPEVFSPSKVRFDSPTRRWKYAFSEGY